MKLLSLGTPKALETAKTLAQFHFLRPTTEKTSTEKTSILGPYNNMTETELGILQTQGDLAAAALEAKKKGIPIQDPKLKPYENLSEDQLNSFIQSGMLAKNTLANLSNRRIMEMGGKQMIGTWGPGGWQQKQEQYSDAEKQADKERINKLTDKNKELTQELYDIQSKFIKGKEGKYYTVGRDGTIYDENTEEYQANKKIAEDRIQYLKNLIESNLSEIERLDRKLGGTWSRNRGGAGNFIEKGSSSKETKTEKPKAPYLMKK